MSKLGKSKPPKISIVIPSYNKADFIKETLDSIVSQDYPNLEIIIQDGGSTDGTVDIIKKYAKKHPDMISWSSEKDKGQVDAINKGLKKATGGVLTFINADDVYEKGALRTVGEYFAKDPQTLWLAGRGKVTNEKGGEISKWVTAYKNFLLKLNSYNLLLIVNYLMQPSVFLSKEAYRKCGPFVGTWSYVMEYDLWLKIGKDKMPAFIDRTLSSFRLSGKNISSTQYNSLLGQDLELAKKYTNNFLVLYLHFMHNIGRKIVVKSL